MHWIDLDRVNKAIEQSGDTSDHNFRVECISAPYYNNNVARVVYCTDCRNHGYCSIEDTLKKVSTCPKTWFCCLRVKRNERT